MSAPLLLARRETPANGTIFASGVVLAAIAGVEMSTIAADSGVRPSRRAPLHSSLFVQVVAGLVLGIVLGMAAPDFAVSLKILSDAFLKLIR